MDLEKDNELQLYTMKEVEALLKMSRRTIYNYLEDGTLKSIKVGKSVRFTHDEIRRFIYGDKKE